MGERGFVELLSPDLLRIYEQAERAFEEGLVERARQLYERIGVALPGNESLERRLSEVRAASRSRSASVEGFDDELTLGSSDLARELGLAESLSDEGQDLAGDFGAVLNLPLERFEAIGLEAAVLAGLSGDWELSERILLRLERERSGSEVKLWRLRCLVELERFTEALALVNAARWEPGQMLHVNYLAGLALESLGIMDQARQRFDAVRKLDPKYRNIAQKNLN